jgi:hypothetical protein
VLFIFIAPEKTSFSAGFETAKLGFSGKHDNHLTTESEAHLSN